MSARKLQKNRFTCLKVSKFTLKVSKFDREILVENSRGSALALPCHAALVDGITIDTNNPHMAHQFNSWEQ